MKLLKNLELEGWGYGKGSNCIGKSSLNLYEGLPHSLARVKMLIFRGVSLQSLAENGFQVAESSTEMLEVAQG